MRAVLLALALLVAPREALAFCGFYVSGADASLYNNATMVVLMRSGTTTVLSMQNNYQGPAEDFAMVIPVPTVLQKDNVKTLPREIFQRVDSLAAPRLVEYWEQDPCYQPPIYRYQEMADFAPTAEMAGEERDDRRYGVKIEAQFQVAEYDIVILSAKDSGGLDAWLRKERYNIPAGAEPVLRGYVEAGTKFFVAKVDAERVTFAGGRAVLSPLRVHYDSPEFSLPVRLGLLNSQGEQDLLVHVLAPGQRYEVANYENATIPTNLRVLDSVRTGFGDFYDSLFRKVTEGRPRTVVTEYSWAAGSCDPCPVDPLSEGELATLGADVAEGLNPWEAVLTRLHYRYTTATLGEDLVFRAAAPIIGGRGMPDAQGRLEEQTAGPSGSNQFQGRYVILHPWVGAITCEDPVRGRWGGPLSGGAEPPASARSPLNGGAVGGGAVGLGAALAADLEAVGLGGAGGAAEPAPPAPTPLDEEALEEDRSRPCSTSPRAGGLALGLLALFGLGRRRR